MMQLRDAWAKAQIRENHSGQWFFRNVVWLDPCNTVLSVSDKAAFDEKQATYGKGPRWMSPDNRMNARNLRASPYATKQCHSGDRRSWWFVVVARGVVKFVQMPEQFSQTGDGMAMLVAQLTNVLKDMIGYDTPLPRVVFTDRGPGFFQGSTGHVVKAYADALKKHGFRPYAGSDASKQPGDVPDCLPHDSEGT